MASYAKQAQDETLVKMARRIQLRAYDRVGELLRQIEPGKTGPKNELQEGDLPQLGRTDAADGVAPRIGFAGAADPSPRLASKTARFRQAVTV
jgi:hypothetical protein